MLGQLSTSASCFSGRARSPLPRYALYFLFPHSMKDEIPPHVGPATSLILQICNLRERPLLRAPSSACMSSLAQDARMPVKSSVAGARLLMLPVCV